MIRRRQPVVLPPQFTLLDLLNESTAGIVQRPSRTMLTMLGVILGVGTVVVVLGLTATATGQISTRFTALTATEVSVEEMPAGLGEDSSLRDPVFTPDADQRVSHINGVRSAGTYRAMSDKSIGSVAGVPIPGTRPEQLTVYGATPGLIPALRPILQSGRLFDAGMDARADHVAVLGTAAARRLGVSRLDTQPVIFLSGMPFTVVGILSDVARRAEVLSAIIVPAHTATATWGTSKNDQSPKMVIDTDLGAAQIVATQAALALRPDHPDLLRVITPPDPHSLRDNVATDLNSLFLVLAGVCLVIGTVGIANTTLVAVLERTSEIGLRRALGARRRHIATQFLTESALIGSIGGLIGASFGVLAIVTVAITKQWTPILQPVAFLPAPLIGTLTGLLAGAYPAIRAARIEPVEAFRR